MIRYHRKEQLYKLNLPDFNNHKKYTFNSNIDFRVLKIVNEVGLQFGNVTSAESNVT